MELSDYEDEESPPAVEGGQGQGQGDLGCPTSDGFEMEAQFVGVINGVLRKKRLGFIRAKLPEKFSRNKDVCFHFNCLQQLK